MHRPRWAEVGGERALSDCRARDDHLYRDHLAERRSRAVHAAAEQVKRIAPVTSGSASQTSATLGPRGSQDHSVDAHAKFAL